MQKVKPKYVLLEREKSQYGLRFGCGGCVERNLYEETLIWRINVRVWVLGCCAELDNVPHALRRAMFAFDSVIICWSAVVRTSQHPED
jgi:hypothetical protein